MLHSSKDFEEDDFVKVGKNCSSLYRLQVLSLISTWDKAAGKIHAHVQDSGDTQREGRDEPNLARWACVWTPICLSPKLEICRNLAT